MKIFQYFFNPKLKEGLAFDSFCYEPTNIYEKRLGSLYMVGLLKSILPNNQNFLDKVGYFIKEKYYKKNLLKPEKALKEALKETNEFLAQIVKEGNINWLGKFSFAVLNFKNFVLNFTKIGEIKICLVRGKKIIDIDKKLRLEKIEHYPLKVFGNIITGKLIENDLVLVFTKEIYDFFQKENLIQELPHFIPFDEEKFKRKLEERKERLNKIIGILFIASLTKKGEKTNEIVAFNNSREFSLTNHLISVLSRFSSGKKEEFSFSKIFSLEKLISVFKNKKFLIVLTFLFLLLFGYFLF